MSIRILIVDDEPLARDRLREFVGAAADVHVVGECANGREALQCIQDRRPDTVFLDIQMPDGDGFEVVRALGPGILPHIVFVTAYDKYAIRAFEVHALDYLLKPINESHVRRALDRAKNASLRSSSLRLLLKELEHRGSSFQRILVRTEQEILCLRPDDIDWIEAAGNYLCLHSGGSTHILRDTLQSFESRAGMSNFIRVSRSALVNLTKIRALTPKLYGDYIIELETGAKVSLSRGYREQFLRRIESKP